MKKILLLSALSSCTLFVESISVEPPQHLIPVSLATGDVDADGDVDLVAVSFTLGAIHLSWLNQLTPDTFLAQVQSFEVPGTDPLIIVHPNTRLIDIDGDQDLDLITPISSRSLQIFSNDGAGNFSFLSGLSIASSMDVVLAEDLDGDELPEVIVATAGAPGSVVFFPNEGGSFAASTELFTGLLDTLLSGDFDGDSRVDLLVVNRSPRLTRISITDNGIEELDLLIDNFAGFEKPFDLFFPVTAGDINGDQTLDLVAAVGDSVVPILNIAGEFSASGSSEIQSGFHRNLLIADLSGDGAQDITVEQVGRMGLLFNVDGAEFVETAAQTDDIFAISAAQLDGNAGDELVCLLSSSEEQAEIVIFSTNNTTNTLSRRGLSAGDLIIE